MRTMHVAFAALCLLLPGWAAAGGGPFGIDHMVHYDDSGIWKRSNQQILLYGTIIGIGASAVWYGEDDTFGNTAWRSVDAMAVSAASAQLLKWTFQRERPSQTTDPNKFFQGWHAQSFPSGEVATITAAVTPFMVTYGHDHPSVYLLTLLPLYDAVARVKTHGHWQSDVLVGAALGAGVGIWASRRDSPWIVSFLPKGVQVGYVHKWD
ncbi:phosphatase PAP2 family protein [Dyella terrae]|uniref:Phosphatase PAP2 family protein n=3 Tax=Rhodanobacteraceae TaxID=1775411 RepID=A0A4R0YU54_9GAMM|nr:phosphatase PAP2 family protein [Dyella terrae]TCI12933.1 phosphatase PAP2 family protein [Dyella soli]